MDVSLRASLLGVVLATALLPLGALGYVELRELDEEAQALALAEFEKRALALAVRAEAGVEEGDDPLATAAREASGERLLLVARDGAWRSPDGTRGTAEELSATAGDSLSGVALAVDPQSGEVARVAWARVPGADASLVVLRDPAPAVGEADWAFFALLASVGAGAVALATMLTWLVVRPVRRLEATSIRLAEGGWDERAAVEGAHEVRSLARTFNAMAEELGALQAARGERLAQRRADLDALHFAMAHDVREPLRSVTWLLEDAAESGEREPLRLARKKVGEVDRVLRDLMRYEDVAVRDAPLADVDLAAVVERAWEASGAAVRLEREGEPPAVVRANAELLATAFTEILRNAGQHGASRVVVRFEAEREDVVIVFDDDGPGVPAARRADALHLFQRLHRSEEGTGVGLAIVRRVAERHGGGARLGSAPEGGLRVEVRLPRGGPVDAREPLNAGAGRRF